MSQVTTEQLNEVIANFCYEGMPVGKNPLKSGHINDTYLLTFHIADLGQVKTILQRINKEVFKYPEELMENVMGVTSYLREHIIENGGNPERETLNVIPTTKGKPCYLDSYGDYWRSYKYVTDATSYDLVEKPEHFYESAVAFGNFQRLLADYPVETLHETIKGFHDTKARLNTFQRIVEADPLGRASLVQKEINFVLERKELADVFPKLFFEGKIPLRVTHNDTKLSNVLIDNKTDKAICVVDLDTVMPGFTMNDFGDSIRFGASTAAEDEPDLDKVDFSLELFELYTNGYITGCGGQLTKQEIALLPMGAKMMTYESGIRFLTDYLQGDTYFKIHRANQNLDRCRTQLKLLYKMENQWDIMNEIVKR
ncbi:MAG: aminoglycoside phosphotransferase family protein [Lachnospiraceae bacterium]|nr:aminoglycoside phosphotransferase family protein [Lachnospiraceae bacterium]